MLNDEEPGEMAIRTFDLCLILHADHGLNASTFTGRVVGSTLSDMYSAITAAIGALKGPLHGGANIEVMRGLLQIREEGSSAADYVPRQTRAERACDGLWSSRVQNHGPARHQPATNACQVV